MLYDLVIVEDEFNVRHGLERCVDWEELGFQIAGSFEEGRQALNYIQENSCDVVLTDIVMSGMDGLELAMELRKDFPNIKIVIISGYNNFEYAKQAIQYQVIDYLLKPVDEDDLEDTLKKIKTQLDSETEIKKKRGFVDDEILYILQKNFLKSLLAGQISSINELYLYFKIFDIDKSIADSPLFVFKISVTLPDVAEDELKNIDCVLRTLLVSKSRNFLYFVINDGGPYWSVMAISLDQQESIIRLKDHCSKKFQELLCGLEGHVKLENISCEVLHVVEKVSDLVTGDFLLIKKDEQYLGEINEIQYQHIVSKYTLFVAELDMGNTMQLMIEIDKMKGELKALSCADIKFIIKNLFFMIEREYGYRNIDIREITHGKFDYSNIHEKESFEEITNEVVTEFKVLDMHLKEIRASYRTDVIELLQKYIENNLSGDLGNDALAGVCYLHADYIGRMFRVATGENLSDYIRRTRMQKAIELLKNSRLGVSEIGQRVGFPSPPHFSHAFKKFTGCSPAEYRRSVLS
ncbi:MAG: response regulator [Lachnospiraceae bacterium]|nr:response regulator [Lachnospiraceae bacterium]